MARAANRIGSTQSITMRSDPRVQAVNGVAVRTNAAVPPVVSTTVPATVPAPFSPDALAQQYQDAMNKANTNNENRYNELLANNTAMGTQGQSTIAANQAAEAAAAQSANQANLALMNANYGNLQGMANTNAQALQTSAQGFYDKNKAEELARQSALQNQRQNFYDQNVAGENSRQAALQADRQSFYDQNKTEEAARQSKLQTDRQSFYDQNRTDEVARQNALQQNIGAQYGAERSQEQARIDKLAQDYGARSDTIMKQFEGAGVQEAADIRAAQAAQDASQRQRLASSGLGATTIGATLANAGQRAQNAELGRLNERLRGQRITTESQLTGDTLGAQERGAVRLSDIGQRQSGATLGAQERGGQTLGAMASDYASGSLGAQERGGQTLGAMGQDFASGSLSAKERSGQNLGALASDHASGSLGAQERGGQTVNAMNSDYANTAMGLQQRRAEQEIGLAGDYNNAVQNQTAQYGQQGVEQASRYGQQILAQQNDVGNARQGIIERRTDQAPDFAQYADLAYKLGQGGYGVPGGVAAGAGAGTDGIGPNATSGADIEAEMRRRYAAYKQAFGAKATQSYESFIAPMKGKTLTQIQALPQAGQKLADKGSQPTVRPTTTRYTYANPSPRLYNTRL
jgi:hypothetical protein